MTIKIRIEPGAFDTGRALESYALQTVPPLANTLQFPAAPRALNDLSAGPPTLRIATASPLTERSNIREDGTFPTASSPTRSQTNDIAVHISATSGSTIIRGTDWDPGKAELNPAYGLNVSLTTVVIQSDLFEAALNEPIGGQFKANLIDLVIRGIIEVKGDFGVILNPGTIASYIAP